MDGLGHYELSGEIEETIIESLDSVMFNAKATKILRNGQILILRGDRTYTLTGQEVQR